MNRYRFSILLIAIGLGLLISHDVEARDKVIGTRAIKTGYVALSAPIKPVHDWLLGLVEEQHRDIFGKIFNDAFQTK